MKYRSLGRTGIMVCEIGYSSVGLASEVRPLSSSGRLDYARHAARCPRRGRAAVSDGKLLPTEVMGELQRHAFAHGWQYPWSADQP